MGLDKDYHHGTPHEDKLCGVRCLAFHLNYNQTGNGFQRLEVGQKHLYSQWKGGRQGTVNLSEMPLFEDMFDIDVDIYSLCLDGAIIPCYLSEERHTDKMVLNLHDTHLSYVMNVPAYLKNTAATAVGRTSTNYSTGNSTKE